MCFIDLTSCINQLALTDLSRAEVEMYAKTRFMHPSMFNLNPPSPSLHCDSPFSPLYTSRFLLTSYVHLGLM